VPERRPQARPALPLVATGLGGRVELWDNEIRIVKGGIFGHLVELLWIGHGHRESTLFLDQIAAVSIIHALVLPSIIRFAYAGGPDSSGDYLENALAENALMMNAIDNRSFYAIKDRVEDLLATRRVRPRLERTGRRRWPLSRGRAR
jgi:hypothetical protein